mmetsp:Transcript_32283/g.70646  ORF Transcript_32283/g.70646 Transcript_32283/m.70646 type:complete len:221 (+) Transcript_32283:3-665(+)
MNKYFSGIFMALLSHFAGISGGLNWMELFTLLSNAGWNVSGFFVVYIIVMTLMVMNIITGIFVNDAIELAQTHKDFALQADKERESELFVQLAEIFQTLDTDCSGKLTFAEFESALSSKEVEGLFWELGVARADALILFDLLDVDGSGELEIGEFVVGCLNLKGSSTALSVEMLLKENKKMMKYMKGRLESLQGKLDDVCWTQVGSVRNSNLDEGVTHSV